MWWWWWWWRWYSNQLQQKVKQMFAGLAQRFLRSALTTHQPNHLPRGYPHCHRHNHHCHHPSPRIILPAHLWLFELNLPTKARKCHLRHFRGKQCWNGTFELGNSNSCMSIFLPLPFPRFYWLWRKCLRGQGLQSWTSPPERVNQLFANFAKKFAMLTLFLDNFVILHICRITVTRELQTGISFMFSCDKGRFHIGRFLMGRFLMGRFPVVWHYWQYHNG